jgi:hypothetical protein
MPVALDTVAFSVAGAPASVELFVELPTVVVLVIWITSASGLELALA